MIRASINLLFLLLLAGCVGKAAPAVAPVNPPPQDREFPVTIRLASQQPTAAGTPIAGESVYGQWLRDQGNVRTWLRFESPRFHLVLVDKAQGVGRVMDGEYTLARDGTLFGVITTVENISQKDEIDGLFRGEELTAIRRAPLAIPTATEKETRVLPFVLHPEPAGSELALDGEALFQGRYQKTAETRPTFARPLPPLGKWVYQNWEVKLRTTLQLSDKIDVEMLDQITGRRLRLVGEYAVTAGNLLYGMFTTLEQPGPSGGVDDHSATQAIPLQLFCFHYGIAGAKVLQVRDITSQCLDEKARDLIQRDYQLMQQDNPAFVQTRGRTRR